MSANMKQVGGDHYKAAGTGLQHWDLVWQSGMGYFPAQITRYTSRHVKKQGLQDVEKALHYVEKYIELANATPGGASSWLSDVQQLRVTDPHVLTLLYHAANPHIGKDEQEIDDLLVDMHSLATLHRVKDLIKKIMYEQYGAVA